MSSSYCRALVVDGDELFREFYTRVLNGRGLEVLCADSIAEADERLTHSWCNRVSLVVVRTAGSPSDQLDAAKAVRSACNGVPLLVVAGLQAGSEAAEQLAAVSEHVLIKGDFSVTAFADLAEWLCRSNPSGSNGPTGNVSPRSSQAG